MMRWFWSLSLMLLVVVGCSDPPPTVLTDSVWRVQCPPSEACVPIPDAFEAINQFNGAPGESGEIVNVRCNATRDPSGDFSDVRLEASEGDERGFEVRNLRIHPVSHQLVESPSCQVTVIDQGFDYDGLCGLSEPSAEQPCQVTSIDIQGSQVTAEVKCDELPSSENATVIRNVLGYDRDSSSATETASLKFQNCTGL